MISAQEPGRPGSFALGTERIGYAEHGPSEGVPLVLTHGLLMNRRMYDGLAPALAKHGHRVVCIDLLGHGASSAPVELSNYSMTAFGEQVVALLDHLGVERAVVGGTSLGANVALELGVAHPERAAGLFVEMPVLEDALVAVAVAFTPVLFAAQLGRPVLGLLGAAMRRVPRSNLLLDIGLDWLRRDPSTSARVLQGLLLGRTCPPRELRREIDAPTLIVGHPSDPIHPFNDADVLAREMPHGRLVNARSILEWRLSPRRLTGELRRFLDEVAELESERPLAA